MATLVSLTQVDAIVVANHAAKFLVTVSNTGASSLTLSSVQISESTESDAQISQPQILTPNVAVGLGNPTIAAGSSASFVFAAVFPSPNVAGPSVNQPGAGPAGMMNGQPADNNFTLQAQCQTSDNAVASTTLMVSVLSAIAPFPRSEGGALQFTQGSNIINGIITGVI